MKDNSQEERNKELGDWVRYRRADLGMSQGDLAKAMGKTRKWIVELERGQRYSGTKFVPAGETALRLAMVLDSDPTYVLRLADVPMNEWPDMSNIKTMGSGVATADISQLTPVQQALVRDLINELKGTNSSVRSGSYTPEWGMYPE